MKPSELRNKSNAELDQELVALRREAFNLRMQAATGAMSGSHEFGRIRRDVARIKTIQRERVGNKTQSESA